MCMSWKCLFSIMTLKSRRFSLDSSVLLDGGGGPLGGRRGSGRFGGKKAKQSQSLDEARLEIHELNRSLNPNMILREQIIEEENRARSDGPVNNHAKHNKTFHKLFQEVPEGETLTHSFSCALQKEVLYHGRLFVSENHVCFHSSVLLKDTKVVILASTVREVKKHNSALSLLSIQTADGEKYSFVSLRHRETCFKLLQTVCLHAQGESSPHLSSAENEGDLDMPSSYSSLEDCPGHDYLDNDFPQMSSEGPTRSNSTRQSSLTDEDSRGVSVPWMWRMVEKVTPFFFLREMRNLSILFYIYIMLMVLLLLASGYIGLRIVALEEQLNSLTELSFHQGAYQET